MRQNPPPQKRRSGRGRHPQPGDHVATRPPIQRQSARTVADSEPECDEGRVRRELVVPATVDTRLSHLPGRVGGAENARVVTPLVDGFRPRGFRRSYLEIRVVPRVGAVIGPDLVHVCIEDVEPKVCANGIAAGDEDRLHEREYTDAKTTLLLGAPTKFTIRGRARFGRRASTTLLLGAPTKFTIRARARFGRRASPEASCRRSYSCQCHGRWFSSKRRWCTCCSGPPASRWSAGGCRSSCSDRHRCRARARRSGWPEDGKWP